MPSAPNHELLARYARLVVEVGANIQPGQVVWIIAEPRAAPLVRAVAAAAYDRGARFVDPWYFDPEVKRIRLERAREDTLDFVPPWYGRRLLALSEQHGSRISITPQVPPGLLGGIDPARAGRDQLPSTAEALIRRPPGQSVSAGCTPSVAVSTPTGSTPCASRVPAPT
jgi:aminopeptidase